MKTRGTCRAHSQRRPCPKCMVMAAAQRASWQRPSRLQAHLEAQAMRPEAWQKEEDDLLRELAGHVSSHEIAARINAWRGDLAGPGLRTFTTVRSRAAHLGVSLLCRGPRMVEEVKHWFGVDTNTMRAWRDNDMLPGKPWGKFWCYTQAELETFVKTYPWAFDNSRMMAGPLRALHAVITRRDPWIRPAELAQMAGCSPETALRYIRLGRIEAHQRTGHNGAHMVRTSSVTILQACVAEARTTRTARMRAWRAAREPQPHWCVFCGCRFMALSQTALVCSKRCRQSRWRLTRTRWGRAA